MERLENADPFALAGPGLILGRWPTGKPWKTSEPWYFKLDAYNNGLLCAPARN